MPWTTPDLRSVRETVRGEITTALGKASFVGNSVLRVLADAEAALTHLVLRYIDWISLQLLPDTAEKEWLDRHGDIWLVNADGSVGRKNATLAYGQVNAVGSQGAIIPAASQLTDGVTTYETTELTAIGVGSTGVKIKAIDAGKDGNHHTGDTLTFVDPIIGVDDVVTVVELTGGVDTETDDQLRERVLRRIQQPPMGGAAYDYEAWALAVPGVTRAWCAPLEMGIGTATVRFVMDDLRADNDGIPNADDVAKVQAYIDTRRPVAVKDHFVVAPVKQPIDFVIDELVPDTESIRAGIEASAREMLRLASAPGQTIYAAWKNLAVMNTPGVESFKLINCDADDVMPSPGHMGVLGSIIYE